MTELKVDLSKLEQFKEDLANLKIFYDGQSTSFCSGISSAGNITSYIAKIRTHYSNVGNNINRIRNYVIDYRTALNDLENKNSSVEVDKVELEDVPVFAEAAYRSLIPESEQVEGTSTLYNEYDPELMQAAADMLGLDIYDYRCYIDGVLSYDEIVSTILRRPGTDKWRKLVYTQALMGYENCVYYQQVIDGKIDMEEFFTREGLGKAQINLINQVITVASKYQLIGVTLGDLSNQRTYAGFEVDSLKRQYNDTLTDFNKNGVLSKAIGDVSAGLPVDAVLTQQVGFKNGKTGEITYTYDMTPQELTNFVMQHSKDNMSIISLSDMFDEGDQTYQNFLSLVNGKDTAGLQQYQSYLNSYISNNIGSYKQNISSLSNQILSAQDQYNYLSSMLDNAKLDLNNRNTYATFRALSDFDKYSNYYDASNTNYVNNLLSNGAYFHAEDYLSADAVSGPRVSSRGDAEEKITSADDEIKILSWLINDRSSINSSDDGFLLSGPQDVHDGDITYRVLQLTSSDGLINDMFHYESFLSDSERQIFNYVLNKNGSQAAMTYLESLNGQLQDRWKDAQDVKWITEGRRYVDGGFSSIVGGSLKAQIMQNSDGIRAFGNSIKAIFSDYTPEIYQYYTYGDHLQGGIGTAIQENQYDRIMHRLTSQGMLSEEAKEIAEIKSNGFFSLSNIYNMAYSMSRSVELVALNAVTGGIASVPCAIAVFGPSSFGSSYFDAKERGLSEGAAFASGLGSAALEVAMEHFTLGHLTGIYEGTNSVVNSVIKAGSFGKFTPVVQWGLGTIMEAASEFEEESLTTFFNSAIDDLITGIAGQQDKSQREISINNYMAQGMTREAAEQAVRGDILVQCLKDGAVGAITGGIMGSVSSGRSAIVTNSYANEILSNPNFTGDYSSAYAAAIDLNAQIAEAANDLKKGKEVTFNIDSIGVLTNGLFANLKESLPSLSALSNVSFVFSNGNVAQIQTISNQNGIGMNYAVISNSNGEKINMVPIGMFIDSDSIANQVVTPQISRYNELLSIVKSDAFLDYQYKNRYQFTVKGNTQFDSVYAEFLQLQSELSKIDGIDVSFNLDQAIDNAPFGQKLAEDGLDKHGQVIEAIDETGEEGFFDDFFEEQENESAFEESRKYSGYDLYQILEEQGYKEICESLLSLASNQEMKTKLESILYNGGYQGFGLSTGLMNHDNPFTEAHRRLSIASLLLTNPDTFDALVQNKINLFHGTYATALPSILEHGLLSVDEATKKGIALTTGETWSRIGGERSFVSLSDILGLSDRYAALNQQVEATDLSFGVIIGTTADDVSNERTVKVGSDTPELAKTKLSLENIKVLLVPSSKVNFVKNLVGDLNIKVLAYDSSNLYYANYDSEVFELFDNKINEFKSKIKIPDEINYDTISTFIRSNDISDSIELLKDRRVKEIIINNYSKNEFSKLLEMDRTGNLLLSLFDEEGCEILKRSSYNIEERVNYLLAWGEAKNELLNKDYFCQLLLDKASDLKLAFNNIDLNNKYFLDYVVNHASSNTDFGSIVYYLGKDSRSYLAKNQNLSIDLVTKYLFSFDGENIEWLLNNRNVGLDTITVDQFRYLLHNNVTIPSRLISDELINKLLNQTSSLFESRLLIEQYSINHDATRFNEILKTKEAESINNIISQGNDANNTELSDLIIDYHFNDISYNVFLNIKEFLSFQVSNGLTTSTENLRLYKDILNIDNLSVEEKMQLHQKLSNINVVEMFYDDMSNARSVMNQEIADSVLNGKKIQKFRNGELSEQYGIDVYSFDGQEFYGLVKSGRVHRSRKNVGGRSFSLVGKDAIGTFDDPHDGTTFLYEGLVADQILHAYPFDSFTSYGEYGQNNRTATARVRVLMTPAELLKSTSTYNEILLLERGAQSSDMDSRIGELKPIALYCYDEITPRDIEIARNEGVGIMLINTSAYSNDTPLNVRGESVWNYNYVENLSDINKFINSRNTITSFEHMDVLDEIIQMNEGSTDSIADAIDKVSTMDVKDINQYFIDSNFDEETIINIISRLSPKVLANYIIETFESIDTQNVCLWLFTSEHNGLVDAVSNILTTDENINKIIQRAVDSNFVAQFLSSWISLLFGRVSRAELINRIYQYLMTDDKLLSTDTNNKYYNNLATYLDIPELKNLLLNSDSVLYYLNNLPTDGVKPFITLLDDEAVYQKINKNSALFELYAYNVMIGNLSLYPFRITDIINAFRNIGVTSEKVNKNQLVHILQCSTVLDKISDKFDKIRETIDKVTVDAKKYGITSADINEAISTQFSKILKELSLSGIQELVDCMSIMQILGNVSDYMSAENYNWAFNLINKALVENNNFMDVSHLQSHIYNFTNYYNELNNIINPLLKEGKTLQIKDKDGNIITYIVEKSDDLYKVASKFDTTVDSIIELNDLKVNPEIKFYYEDDGTAGSRGNQTNRIRFNTKFFSQKFKSDNRFVDILETIFHESFHAMQGQENSFNVAGEKSLINLIDFIIQDELGNTYYDSKTANYWNVSFEIDARYNSYVLLSNYLKEISPKTYEKMESYLSGKLIEDFVLYDENINFAKYAGLYLNRDMLLDRIVVQNPSLLEEYPLLRYLYNENGMRKTIFQLQDVIRENAGNINVAQMINYWIKTSKYSLDNFLFEIVNAYISGVYETGTSISEDITKLVRAVIDKNFNETMMYESNYFQDQNFVDRIIDYMNKLKEKNPSFVDKIDQITNIILSMYNKRVNAFKFENLDVETTFEFLQTNESNPDLIKRAISSIESYNYYHKLCNYVLKKRNQTLIGLLYSNEKNFKLLNELFNNDNFNGFVSIFSTMEPSLVAKFIDIKVFNKLSAENKAKFAEKFPEVMAILNGQEVETENWFDDEPTIGDTATDPMVPITYLINIIKDEQLFNKFNNYAANASEFPASREALLEQISELSDAAKRNGIDLNFSAEEQARLDQLVKEYNGQIADSMSIQSNISMKNIFSNFTSVRKLQKSAVFKNVIDSLAKLRSVSNQNDNNVQLTVSDVKEIFNQLSSSQVQELIDCMSILQNLKNTYSYISADDYNLLFNCINSLLIEDCNLVDEEHLKSHISNFTKYYCELNGLNIDVMFLYDENHGGFYNNGKIWFNTKFFPHNFPTENGFADILGIIFHETFHAMQDQEFNAGIANKYSLINQIETILMNKIGDDKYYMANYRNISLEVDTYNVSTRLLMDYIKEISPNGYEKIIEFYDSVLSEYKKYGKNNNMAEYDGLNLSRDMLLDKVIAKEPSLLEEYPLLKYIYNDDGTRKTIFQLQDVIRENAGNSNIENMINYWIKTSKYSLDTIFSETFDLYLKSSDSKSALNTLYYLVYNKLVETFQFESDSYRNVSAYFGRVFDLINKLKYENPSLINEIEQFKKNFVRDCISTITGTINYEYGSHRDSAYENYKMVIEQLLSNESLKEFIPYISASSNMFPKYVRENLNSSFDKVMTILSTLDQVDIADYVDMELLDSLSSENREKFIEKFPQVVEVYEVQKKYNCSFSLAKIIVAGKKN